MEPSKNKPHQSSGIEKMHLDPVSASYIAPGSTKTRFPVSATKQSIPVDDAIQKYTTPVFTQQKNMPLDQVSASYMAPGSTRPRFPLLAR